MISLSQVRLSPKKRDFMGVAQKNLIFGLFLGQKWALAAPQELAQQHEQHKNVVFLVSGHDGNEEIGGCGQKIDFWPKNPLFGSGRVFIASTPNFGPSLTKLVGTIRFTKKMTHNDNGAGPGRIYGETAVFTFCRKAENGPKIRFFPKKILKFAKRLIFIWEKGTFFLGPKNPDFGPKLIFFVWDAVFFSKGARN